MFFDALIFLGVSEMIDITSERVVSLAEAVNLVPRRTGGKLVHATTLHAWATKGLNGIRLETINVGGHRATSAAALQRFFDRLTELDAEKTTAVA
jgi:hypothetical protein